MNHGKYINQFEFTPEQMAQALSAVVAGSDWREPINMVIADPGQRNLECLRDAITFFTCSVPVIQRVGAALHVQAAGYYAMQASTLCYFNGETQRYDM